MSVPILGERVPASKRILAHLERGGSMYLHNESARRKAARELGVDRQELVHAVDVVLDHGVAYVDRGQLLLKGGCR